MTVPDALKVAQQAESCRKSLKLPKKPKVAEKLPSNLWTGLRVLMEEIWGRGLATPTCRQ